MNLKDRIRELIEESLEGGRGRARREDRRARRRKRKDGRHQRQPAEAVRVPELEEGGPKALPGPVAEPEDPEEEPDDVDGTEGWGQDVNLGEDIQVRSRAGTRAGCVPVRDGLFLVGAVPEALADDMGILPLLAPLMRRSASRALKQQDPVSDGERRGLLANVLHRSRKVNTRSDANGSVELEVPHVGFAGSDDVADLLGCSCTMRREK